MNYQPVMGIDLGGTNVRTAVVANGGRWYSAVRSYSSGRNL
jgi:predicted NBD/HSP70 family sugar kinase